MVSKMNNNKIAAINTSEVNLDRKGLSYDGVLESFVSGSNGIISSWDKQKHTNDSLVIRGVSSTSQDAIKHCWETGRTFYAIDTGYFGNGKVKRWHRVTKNNLQNLGPVIYRPDDRIKLTNYSFKKFTPGSKILICPPSEKIMSLFNQPTPDEWVKQVVRELRKYTDRPVEIRLKPTREERTSTHTIEAALANDVHCLVTYNSIAAVESLIYGKPAIALGPNAAHSICNTKLSDVENLNIPTQSEMYHFMCHLSYCQFTLAEMENGTAWRIINEGS